MTEIDYEAEARKEGWVPKEEFRGDNPPDVFLMRVDDFGVPVWVVRYQLPYSLFPMGLEPAANGDWILTGTFKGGDL